MLDRDVIAVLIEHVPDEIRTLRDRIADTEAQRIGPVLERYRELHEHIQELKDRCAQAGHSLTIVLAGKAGTRRRLMKNRRDERRACVMCGTEEIGTPATRFLSRFLLRRGKWKFETLNDISRVPLPTRSGTLRRYPSSGISRLQPMLSCITHFPRGYPLRFWPVKVRIERVGVWPVMHVGERLA